MDKKRILKLQVIGFIFISIVGTLLHFTYEWLGSNFYVGLFTPVNESVWEHLKLAVFANLIFMIYEHIKIGKMKNYLPSKLVFSIVYMISVLVIHYTVELVFKRSIPIVDMASYYISVFIAQYFAYQVLIKKELKPTLVYHSKIVYILLIILFFLFTVYPPKVPLFQDSITKTYGIFNLKGD